MSDRSEPRDGHAFNDKSLSVGRITSDFPKLGAAFNDTSLRRGIDPLPRADADEFKATIDAIREVLAEDRRGVRR